MQMWSSGHVNGVLLRKECVCKAKKTTTSVSQATFLKKQMRQADFYFFLFPNKTDEATFLFDQNTMRHLFLFILSIKMRIF